MNTQLIQKKEEDELQMLNLPIKLKFCLYFSFYCNQKVNLNQSAGSWKETNHMPFTCCWTRSIASNLDYFQEKLMKTFFKKNPQKPYFGGHFGPFLPKFGQKWFFLKKRALSVLKYSNYLKLCQKSEKTISQKVNLNQFAGSWKNQANMSFICCWTRSIAR